MANNRQRSIEGLSLHLENLRACATFAAHKACHCAWVELLIAELKADMAKDAALKHFVASTEEHLVNTITRVTEEKSYWRHVPDDEQKSLKSYDEPCHGPQDTTCDICGLGLAAAPCELMIPERGHCPTCSDRSRMLATVKDSLATIKDTIERGEDA